MKQSNFVVVILAGAAMLACGFSASAQELGGCEQHIKYGAPSDEEVLLCRLGYALSFDTDRKVADWVAYHLTGDKMRGTLPRSNDYRADPDLEAGERSELSDYRNSGFDRGHMAPAAAMKWDGRAMSESFFLTNMAPQVGAGFNQGIWRTLEARVRKWTSARGELYVVTGPIYETDPPQEIGTNEVQVPSHFFKVIFDPLSVDVIAFVLPNASNPSSSLPTFIVAVVDIEQRTGLDFLPELADDVEALIEDKLQPGMW